jgi:hypothetical protein
MILIIKKGRDEEKKEKFHQKRPILSFLVRES